MATVNAVQKMVVAAAAGGTVYLMQEGAAAVSPYAMGANAAALQTALEGLSSIGAGNVAVTGSASLTGATAKTIRLTLASATGAGTLQGVSAALGESAATLQAALRALAGVYADVVVSAAVPSASGGTAQVQTLVAASVSGAVTVGGNSTTCTVTPGDANATVQSAIQGLGGVYADATVTGGASADPGVPALGIAFVVSGYSNTSYNGTYVQFGTHNGQPYWKYAGGGGDRFLYLNAAPAWVLNSSLDDGGYEVESNTGSGSTPPTGTLPWSSVLTVTQTGGGTVSGSYIITLTVGDGNATLLTTEGGGWSNSITSAYVAPTASGYFDIEFTTGDGNATVTLAGTGWSQAVQQAYAAAHYDGTFTLTFQNGLAAQDVPNVFADPSYPGVTISTFVVGGSNVNLITATGAQPSHDNAVDSTNGGVVQLDTYYAEGTTPSYTMAVEHSTDDGVDDAYAAVATFDAVTDAGDSQQVTIAPGTTVKRWVRGNVTAISGAGAGFGCAVVLVRRN